MDGLKSIMTERQSWDQTMAHVIEKVGGLVTQTDWSRLRSITDEDIAQAVANDPDAAPIPTADDLKRYERTPARKKR